MRFILDERELLSLRKIATSLVMKRYANSSYLFLSARDYREWAYGVVDEAIAVALSAEDWKPELARDDTASALAGLRVWYVYMKCRPIADQQLRQERRYKRAVEATIVAEHPPDYLDDEARVLDNLDLERALPLLSPDQAAAISLLHFAHLSIADAAKIMKRTRSAMDMLLSRARKRLSEIMMRPSADQRVQAILPLPSQRSGRLHEERDLDSRYSQLRQEVAE